METTANQDKQRWAAVRVEQCCGSRGLLGVLRSQGGRGLGTGRLTLGQHSPPFLCCNCKLGCLLLSSAPGGLHCNLFHFLSYRGHPGAPGGSELVLWCLPGDPRLFFQKSLVESY